MLDAAIKALAQMFSSPFRSVLLKAVALTLALLVVVGIGLHRSLVWFVDAAAYGSKPASARMSMVRSALSNGCWQSSPVLASSPARSF